MFAAWIESTSPTPVTGPIEVVSERPWSMLATVPVDGGRLWFKENRARTRHETFLLDALSRWVPDAVLAPHAVDHQRGWTLQPDGGPTLRGDGKPDLERWESLLADHARLQRRLVPHVEEMLAGGVPDQRPERLLPEFDRLVAAHPSVPVEVASLRTRLAARAADLGGAIPATLQHDDLHDNNMFRSGQTFDWGDAAVAHPFGVLLVALRVAGGLFEVERRDPLLYRLRDAYLGPWSDLADADTLGREVENTIELAKIGRAMSWERALDTEAALVEYGEAVPGWLGELAEVDLPA